MKKVIIISFVVLLVAVAYFYLATYAIRQGRLEDANDIMRVNPYRVYKKSMESDGAQTVIFRIPCPDGYNCQSIMPDKLKQTITSISNDGMKYLIEFNRCSGESCMDELAESLKVEGGISNAESYLKDKRL